MKTLFKIMSVMLVLCMLFSMTACSTDTGAKDTTNSADGGDDTSSESGKFADIAGDYVLDAASLGMPMKWYIKINADGAFNISTKRDFSDNKGEGTVGGKDGTYMLVYKENTTENPKTATFTIKGKSLVFSTNVPIGAASVSPKPEEELYPTAKLIAYEDVLGTYMGEYEKASAMAGTVLYSYELVLGYGAEYAFESSFTMGGTEYTRTEEGNFAINGTEISFTAATVNGETAEGATAAVGSIADKSIKAAFKLSDMASEAQEIEAKLAVYADVAGRYTGTYKKAMGGMALSYGAQLDLDAFGGYKYIVYDLANGTKESYSEEGSFTYEAGKFTFTSTKEGAAAVEGTYANYVLTTKLPIDAQTSMAASLTLYNEAVNGVFYALTAQDGVNYAAQMYIEGNEFTLAVGIKESSAPKYIAKGTIEIKAGMVTSIVLTTTGAYTDMSMSTPVDIPLELKTVTGAVAESAVNLELLFDLDDTMLIGFQFTHDSSILM